MEKRKPAKSTRSPASEKAAPARRRKKADPASHATFRHGGEVYELNAGQIHLLHALLQEHSPDLLGTLEPEAELVLETDKPGLGEFFRYKLEHLHDQQQRLAALFAFDA